MSMPQIPEEKNRPTLCEVTIDILKSVALEETALAHIINAEGERSQAVIHKYESCRDEISLDELTQSVRQTEKMLSTIIMKEWLLLRKIETACDVWQKLDCKEKEKEKEKEKPCRRCNCTCLLCCICGLCRNCCRC